MSDFTFYNPDGRITWVVKASLDDIALNSQWGIDYIEGAYYASTHYVKDGAAMAKQDYTPTVLGNFVGNLPVPCEVEIEGTSYHVDDGAVVLTANLTGPYTIKIKSLTHLDKEVTIP